MFDLSSIFEGQISMPLYTNILTKFLNEVRSHEKLLDGIEDCYENSKTTEINILKRY